MVPTSRGIGVKARDLLSMSTEFALDFMFWPTKDVGWYFEPTYSINPRTGERSAAFSVGLLFGFHCMLASALR
jgi:hypothetical protein